MPPSDQGRDLLSAIERPLQYLTKKGTSTGVKNLSGHILEVSRKALSSGLPEEEVRLFRGIQELFSGFDSLEEETQIERIRQALSLLHPAAPVLRGDGFAPEEHPRIDVARLKEAYKRLGGRVQFIKGVGPALSTRLAQAGIRTIHDLLLLFPTRFQDRRTVSKIRDLKEGEMATVIGSVDFAGVAYYRGLRRRIFEVTVSDGTGKLKLKWFRFAYGSLEEKIQRGQKLIVCGKSREYRSQMEMHHPDFEVFSSEIDSISFGRIVPVYREVGGMFQKTLRKILH